MGGERDACPPTKGLLIREGRFLPCVQQAGDESDSCCERYANGHREVLGYSLLASRKDCARMALRFMGRTETGFIACADQYHSLFL